MLLCALGQPMRGQKTEPAARVAATVAQRTAQAVRVDRAPRMDAALDDPIWLLASPVADFRQREPYEGQTATERTEVRVLYSRNEVYFGIACHDSLAHGQVATQLRRDVTQELDDYFEIVIDSRHDRRNAYVFQVNPLGTQRALSSPTSSRVRPRTEIPDGTASGPPTPAPRQTDGRQPLPSPSRH